MNRPGAACAAVLAAVIPAVAFPPAAAADPVVSGILSSSASVVWDRSAAEEYSFGLEDYANLRLKADAGDRGTVHAAVNLIAASGNYAGAALVGESLIAGDNYAAAIELERLYFRVRGEAFDLEAGLLRIPFGYGQAYAPTDFINPPNPLIPEARPRAVLGGTLTLYPADTSRLLAFAAAGSDPAETDGGGSVFGLGGDMNTGCLSVQALYAYQTPSSAAPESIHRGGLSFKLEAGASIVAELLYSWDGGALSGADGLRGSLGIDYSIMDGDLSMLCQYLYNGPGLLERGTLDRTNYVYASLLYRLDDYTGATLSALAGLDDGSLVPGLGVEHELFQGCAAGLSLNVAMDGRQPRSASAAVTVKTRF